MGRRLHKSDPGFGRWCKDAGFGDMDSHDRADAMWLAENWASLCDRPITLGHPHRIRRWWDSTQRSEALAATELGPVAPTKKPQLSEEDGRRVAKTAKRAESGDQGADIAQRQLEALARKYETTVEELTEAARIAAPFTYFQFTPSMVDALDDMRGSLRVTAEDLQAMGISKDAVRALFINVANNL